MNTLIQLTLTVTSVCHAFSIDLHQLFSGQDLSGLSDHDFFDNGFTLNSFDDIYSSQAYAKDFLNDLNNELRQWKHSLSSLEWDYKTNITDANMVKITKQSMRFQHWYQRRAKEARKFNLEALPQHLHRQLFIFTLSVFPRDKERGQRQTDIHGMMEGIYGSGRPCLKNNSCVALEPDLVRIMADSRDPEMLKDAWVKWRGDVGPRIKPYYQEFIGLLNRAAEENGYSDYSQYWKESLFYKTPELDSMIRKLWTDIKPLYLQLHAYVRRKLRQHYGSDVVGHDGTIPAHLMGNMWAQHWTNIMDIVRPFPHYDKYNQIQNSLKSFMSVPSIFRMAENFYTSLGLFPMSPTFWDKSMFIKPQSRDVVCHPSSFDSFYPGDFRIKMCSQRTFDTFKTVHHEMGHIEYFMAYADQPTIFREGANSAFHEALGDTIQLSALSNSNLKALGLVRDSEMGDVKEQERSEINSLMEMALEKLAFIPFGLQVDEWRWAVMRGDISPDNYNKMWWRLRLEYEGIRSPVPRSEKDFDPGAKYHIPAHSPYISYFVSFIQQFQMYKALCDLSDYDGPLHECDFYGSKKAGKRLRHIMSMGSSQPWQSQLKYLTGNSQVSAGAILEYFKPLYDWLRVDNAVHGETIGWAGATINWEE